MVPNCATHHICTIGSSEPNFLLKMLIEFFIKLFFNYIKKKKLKQLINPKRHTNNAAIYVLFLF